MVLVLSSRRSTIANAFVVPSAPTMIPTRARTRRATTLRSLQEPPSQQEAITTTTTTNSGVSKSGIPYETVIQALESDLLFPTQGLDQRYATSRKDGYWPFVSNGEEPPKELVYGEFDIDSLAKALDRAVELLLEEDNSNHSPKDITFCDLGSGTGRLVLATAALHPDWKLCKGIELLPGIHEQAVQKLNACKQQQQRQEKEESNTDTLGDPSSYPVTSPPPPQQAAQAEYWKQFQQYTASDDWLNQLSEDFEEDDENEEQPSQEQTLWIPPKEEAELSSSKDETDAAVTTTVASTDNGSAVYSLPLPGDGNALRLAPIELTCGSFEDHYNAFFGDANIVFCFSSAMPQPVITNIAKAIGRQCVPGTIVITTEYQLPLGGKLKPLSEQQEHDTTEEVYELELIESFTGTCSAVGGESTIYFHRVVQSAGTGIPLQRPQPLSVSELAYRATQYMEQNCSKDETDTFVRNVRNQMAFLGLPESWWSTENIGMNKTRVQGEEENKE